MLDLGIRKLEKFSLPEEIVGERVVLVPRRHEFDEALFELIDSSRNFLREYLFWVDDTRSVDDVRKVTDIFRKTGKTGRFRICFSGSGEPVFGRCRGNTYDFLSASLCRVRLLSEPERGRTRIYNRGGAASGKRAVSARNSSADYYL